MKLLYLLKLLSMQPNISKSGDALSSIRYNNMEFRNSYPQLYEHQEFLIIWIKEGTGKLYIEASTYSFYKGDVFLIHGGIRYYFKAEDSVDTHFKESIAICSVYFDPNHNLSGLFGLPEMSLVEGGIVMTHTSLKIPEESSDAVRFKLKQMEGCSEIKLLTGFIGLIDAIYKIEKSVLFDSSRIHQAFKKSDRIYPVLDYLSQHYDEKISLDRAAEMTCMTPNSFCRYFKKTTGRTLVAYVHELRIEEVCNQLLSRDRKMNVVDLAYRVGFNTVSNFNRAFKSIKGTSPKNYLKRHTAMGR